MLSILLSLLALENKEKLGYLSVLVTQLRNEYSSWIRGVQKFKLETTKRDKLAVDAVSQVFFKQKMPCVYEIR